MKLKNKSTQQLHARIHFDDTEKISQEEARRRLKDLFLLLWEIDQQNKVLKGHADVTED